MSRLLIVLTAVTLTVAFLSLMVGPARLGSGEIVFALMGTGDLRMVTIVQEIRLPRMILGLLVGGALGMSGAAFQGLLRNPLAEPGIIGTSSSAGLGAVIALYFGWSAFFPAAVPASAMIFAAVATGALVFIAGRASDTLILILAGIAVSSLAVALTSLAMNLSPNPYALSEMVLWLLGSLKDRSFDDVILAAPFVMIGGSLLFLGGRSLDALILGEETAISLGVSLNRLRLLIVSGAALAVGAVVAASGSIGFVGLVVPHLLRPFVGHRPSRLLLPSALGGAALVTLADIFVRLIPIRAELMLGVVTALVGAPFFLFLIFRMRRGQL